MPFNIPKRPEVFLYTPIGITSFIPFFSSKSENLVEYFGMDLSSMVEMKGNYGASPMMSSMSSFSPMGGSSVLWQEMLPGDNGKLINDLLDKQYDVIYGSWPTEYDEIVLVVDEKNEIDDMTLYALGLKSKEEIDALADAAFNKTNIESKDEKWSFEEICDMEFRTILSSDCYKFDEKTGSNLGETLSRSCFYGLC